MAVACPLCQTEVPEPARTCPRCRADVALLADLAAEVGAQLRRADAHRLAGEIAPAVEAYLAVLDADPTNAEARAALGPVLRAVRAAARIGDGPAEGVTVRQMAAVLLTAAAAVALGFGGVLLLR